MNSKERPIPQTVIREKEESHTEAVRANAIFDALLERRENWYQKYRPGLEIVPEVKPQIAKRYKRQAVRLIEAVEKQGDFIQELREKGYKKSTIKKWQKRTDLASQVLQEKFEGQGVALAGGKTPSKEKVPFEEAPPPIAPEPRRTVGRDIGMEAPPVEVRPVVPPEKLPRVELPGLVQAWEGLRTRFGAQARQRAAERVGAFLEEWRGKVPSVDWRGIPAGAKDQLLGLARRTKAPKLFKTLRGLGAPLSQEEMKEAVERQKVVTKERKEVLGRVWERMKGISVLPSASAVKGWVDGIWAKVSTPPRLEPPTEPKISFTSEEELEAFLEARKVKFKMPQFRKISIKEVWGKLDKKNKVRLGIAAALIAGGAGIAYEIEGRHGQDWQWIVSHFSGIGAVTREIKVTPTAARAVEVTPTPLVTPTPIITPEPEVVVKEEEVKKEAEIAVEEKKAPEDLVKEALAAKQEAVELATQKVKEFAQAGVAIPEGSHPWGVSEQIAEQIIQGSGVEKTEGVFLVTTDAIKDLSGWADKGEEAKPDDIVEFDPARVADHLSARTKAIAQVKAVEGKLEVEVTDEDLGSLVSVVEFLRSL